MMNCVLKIFQKNCKTSSSAIQLVLRANYSRRSDKNTSSYKVIQSNDDGFDDLEHTVFGVNPNWELLTPRGFRFYLPGSIGPGWLDSSTTAQVNISSVVLDSDEKSNTSTSHSSRNKNKLQNASGLGAFETNSTLHCVAQECPTLLRKGVMELFPSCLEVSSPQLTIITIIQNSNKKSRWCKEIETEKLAQHFVLAASDICRKLKLSGYWADFINPFSGYPYLHHVKNEALYKTDERFRSIGFKVEQKKDCKVISHDNSVNNFVGNLYTTAPPNMEFLKELMNDVED